MHHLQGAPTCWFSEVKLSESKVSERGESTSQSMAPASTLLALQRIIQQRKEDTSGVHPSVYFPEQFMLQWPWG